MALVVSEWPDECVTAVTAPGAVCAEARPPVMARPPAPTTRMPKVTMSARGRQPSERMTRAAACRGRCPRVSFISVVLPGRQIDLPLVPQEALVECAEHPAASRPGGHQQLRTQTARRQCAGTGPAASGRGSPSTHPRPAAAPGQSRQTAGLAWRNPLLVIAQPGGRVAQGIVQRDGLQPEGLRRRAGVDDERLGELVPRGP